MTAEEIIAKREEIEKQRIAISDEIERLNDIAARDPRWQFKELHQTVKDQLNHAIYPLKDKIKVLRDQNTALERSYREQAKTQKDAAEAPERARKAAEAQRKAVSAAKKEATDNLEDASAQAFGLGPKKGIGYALSQGAFYDPSKGQIAIPEGKPKAAATPKNAKGDANAGKQVQAEISQIAKNAGVQGPVSPSSFFGENGFDMEPDKDGNYVYNVNGTDVTVPQATAERLQEKYNESLPPEQEETDKTPTQGVKYIPVDTFRQAGQMLDQIKGPGLRTDPVEYQLARENRNYLAQPAIEATQGANRAAVPGLGGSILDPARSFNAPRPIPATTIAGQAVPEVIPDRSGITPSIEPGRDIPTAVNAPSAMSYLNSGVNPIFGQIAQRNKAIAAAPDRAVQRFEGQLSKDQARDNAAKVIDELGPDATPEQISYATEVLNKKTAAANQAPSSGYDILAKVGDTANSILRAIPEAPWRAAGNYLAPSNNSFINNVIGAIPQSFDRPDKEKIPELKKQFAADKITGAIPPSVSQTDYVNFFLRGPQETNLDSARYAPTDQ